MRWQAKIRFHICKSKNIILPKTKLKKNEEQKYPCDGGSDNDDGDDED